MLIVLDQVSLLSPEVPLRDRRDDVQDEVHAPVVSAWSPSLNDVQSPRKLVLAMTPVRSLDAYGGVVLRQPTSE